MKKGIFRITVGMVGCVLALATQQVGATTYPLNVGLTDSHAIGDVINGIQAGGQANRDVTMVNNLLTVTLDTQSSTIVGDLGDIYQRSANNFSPLPAATTSGNVMASGIAGGGATLTIDLSLYGSFRYLVAAYDGPNGGVEVWDIADILSTDSIVIPRYAEPSGTGNPPTGPLVANDSQYLMTGWTLLNPTGTSVPDGGSTIALLGAAILGIGSVRRVFSRK